MSKRCSLSIKSQMIFLIVVMSLAPLGIIIFTAIQTHKHEKQNAWLAAERVCNDIANQQNVLLSGAEQLLSSFSYVPSIRNRDARAVNALFAELAKKNPGITNILIADTTGRVWASSFPMPGAIMANDRRYFRNALATGKFSSGEYTIGRVLNRPTLGFGYPLRDDSGKIRDIAIVAFTLESYKHLLKMKKMPDNTSLVLTDHKGTILFDAGDPQFIGKEDKGDIFRRLSEGTDKGNFEATGITGKHRYFAYQKIRLGDEQAPYMYIRTGILKEYLITDALAFDVGIMGLFTLLAICFAAFTSNRCIVDKILALRDAAQQIGNGNLLVRVSDAVSGGELGELGRTFDEMSHRLADDQNKREKISRYLKQSEAKYRMLVETAYEGVWAINEGNFTTFVNPQMAAMLGYSKEEMLGYEPGCFVAPEDLHEFREQMALLHQGSRARSELHFKKKDGSIICLLTSASPLLNSEGGYSGAFAMLNDITDRKQAEDSLRLSSINLKATLNATADGILAVDESGKVLFVNDQFRNMWNIPEDMLETCDDDALIGYVSEQLANPDYFQEQVKQLYASNESSLDTIHFKDGKVFERYSFPLQEEESGTHGRVWSFRDVSERVSVQKELSLLLQEVETRNSFVESVISNLQSGIIVVDLNYRIKMVNSHVAELCEIPIQDFVGRNLTDICPGLYENILADNKNSEMLTDFCKVKLFIGYACVNLFDSVGNTVGYVINFKDLSEVVKIRKELRHKERLSAMGEVVASVAHEMRNPLFAISSVAQILEMELSLNHAQKELMASLLKESRRINDLVEELLDSTRELRLKRKSVELNGVVADTFLVMKSTAESKSINLRKTAFAGNILIHADSQKLEQVMINLVKNAIEASPKGSVVDLKIEEGTGEVVISVIDSGEGISPEVVEKIFDVFFTTKRGGTGLGLSICRNIIEAHGGTLSASNNPGSGATFTVRLPSGGGQ